MEMVEAVAVGVEAGPLQKNRELVSLFVALEP